MLRFVIPLETPSKKNSRVFLKNGFNIPSKQYQRWHEKAKPYIFNQTEFLSGLGLGFTIPIEKEVRIKLTFYHGDQRRRDSDNGTSSILDLLQDCYILKDDCWQIVRALEILNYYDKGNPRCVIEITDFETN